MTTAEFEECLNKSVKLVDDSKFQLPNKHYKVTAALSPGEHEENAIFAIMAHDYNFENKHWFTIKIEPKDFESTLKEFEVIDSV